MKELTNIQYLNDEEGKPAFAVLPIATLEWLKQKANIKTAIETGIPSAVAGIALDNNYSALRAWREYLGLTQEEVAQRLGISQSAYSQHENAKNLRKTTRIKIAYALGLNEEQLDF
ncbi:TPA: helix-turn-helix domain-containing protein [Mannheimia haemolytica]